jgi:hypothetical protein
MEHHLLLALHFGKYMGSAATLNNNRPIGRLSRQTCFWSHRHCALKICVNRASIILGLPSWKIKGLCDYIDPYSNYQTPDRAKMPSITSPLHSNIQRQHCVNNSRPCIFKHQGAVRIHSFVIELLATFLWKNSYDNIVTMPHNEHLQCFIFHLV